MSQSQTQSNTAQNVLEMQTEMNLAEIQQNISELQTALMTAHPEMNQLLRKIHSKLKADPAVVTLLTEDEIAQVIAGLKEVTNVSFVSSAKTPKAKKPATGASRIKDLLAQSGLSSDDF